MKKYRFLGMQEGFGTQSSFPLYDLLVALPGHPVGSTVSRDTLIEHGIWDEPIEIEDIPEMQSSYSEVEAAFNRFSEFANDREFRQQVQLHGQFKGSQDDSWQ